MEQENQSFELSRFTIKVKLILIISAIIILSLASMIVLASIFFRSDSEKRVQENNLRVTEVLGQRVEAELLAMVANLRTNALALSQSQEKDKIIQLFFQNYPNILFFANASFDGRKVRFSQTLFNQSYLQEVNLDAKKILDYAERQHTKFAPAFAGDVVMANVSAGFSFPAFAIAAPLEKTETTTILLAFIGLGELQRSFAFTGITTTFMIGPTGEVMAHPDEKVVLAAQDFSSLPIVEALLTSKVETGQIRYLYQGKAYLGSYKKLPLSGLGIVSIVEEDKALEEVYNITRRNIYILVIVLGASILVVFFYARSLTRPIINLTAATREIQKGNFRVNLKPETRDEIGYLTDSFVKMGLGLEEREKVKQILGAMIDPVVVQEAMRDLAALKRGAERTITAFFSDVAGFSTISEKLRSEELAALLNEYLSAMTNILKKHEGVLDKYIGDAIVGIWNAPLDVKDHPLKAARASIEMLHKLEELRQYWKKNNLYIKEAQEMDIRIGLNYGPAKTGFMGTEALASFTMMGDTVNLAARLEAAAKDYGVNILISEMVQKQIEHEMFTRKLDLVRVKGKNEPVTLYELVGKKNEISAPRGESAQLFEEGLSLYLKRDFKKAIQIFQKAEKVRQEKDKAAQLLIERCEIYLEKPPPDDWDGVYTRTHK
ncbi:MAG: HAMP domain-containing protein [Leptospiraceae bacterium]|nr:HAMP domain-containing protein [Leptospiraceae bacterium]MDW8307624.1 adenylate/guanylate cyclase domain-containing protein [Leptospiraceae bacterium]